MSSPTAAEFEELKEGLNKAWIIICGGIIFSMQAGFALLEAGGIRKKNSHVVWHKLIINSLITAFTWWLCGYAIAFGDPHGEFVGGERFFAGNKWLEGHGEFVTQYGHWMFQVSICSVVVAITGGSLSERMTLKATAIHTFIMTIFIYPFIISWTWGGGWLAKNFYYRDFTGSGMVHCTGAYAGLAGLLIIGPRYNRFGNKPRVLRDPEARPAATVISSADELTNWRKRIIQDEYEEFGLTNVTYTLFGGLLLWFQFIFFNAGSSLVMHGANFWLSAEKGAVNTFMGGLGAGAVALAIKPYICQHTLKPVRKFRDDAATLCNGLLGGMVANGAGMDTYEPWESMVVGMIAGLFYCLACLLFEKLHLDDALEAWQLHGVCGTIGVFLEAFFNHGDGIFHGNPTGGKVLGRQMLGWLCISVWSFGWSFLVFYALKVLKILRVDLKTEVIGYDFMDYAENVRLVDLSGQIKESGNNASSAIELNKFGDKSSVIDLNSKHNVSAIAFTEGPGHNTGREKIPE